MQIVFRGTRLTAFGHPYRHGLAFSGNCPRPVFTQVGWLGYGAEHAGRVGLCRAAVGDTGTATSAGTGGSVTVAASTSATCHNHADRVSPFNYEKQYFVWLTII